jgi:hypothetical protein
MRRRLVPWLLVALLVGLSSPASALVLQRFSLKDLVARSVAVVRGTVQGSEARWDADGRHIHTYWKVAVSEPVYGAERGQVLTVITLGGLVGDVRQSVAGNVRLSAGEDVFLFLVPNGGAFSIAGVVQGKYSVVPHEGGPRLARDVPQAPGDLPSAPTLDELVTKVRELRKEVTR